MLFLLIFAVALATSLGVAYHSWQGDLKRRAALKTWATANDWRYQDRDDSVCRLNNDLFRTGSARRTGAVLKGQFGGRPATVFGYRYTQQTGKSSTTYHFRVFLVTLPCYLGYFEVKPEGIFAKIGNKLGFADVQLESDDFNRAFRLSAASKKFAYSLMPASNMDLLLEHPTTDMKTLGTVLMLVESGKLAVGTVEQPLAVANEFLDNVPPFVWKDHGAQ